MPREAINYMDRLEELSSILDENEHIEHDVFTFFETLPFPAFVEVYNMEDFSLKAEYKNKSCLELVSGNNTVSIIKNPRQEMKTLLNRDSLTENEQLACNCGFINAKVMKWVNVSLEDNTVYILGIIMEHDKTH